MAGGDEDGNRMRLMRAPKSGGKTTELFQGDRMSIAGATRDSIYVQAGVTGFGAQALVVVPKGAGAARTVCPDSVRPAIARIDGKVVLDLEFPGFLRSVSLDAGAATELGPFVLADHGQIVTNASYVYVFAPVSGTLARMRRSDRAVDVLKADAASIGADADHLYWVDNVARTLNDAP